MNFVTILGPARQGKSFLMNCLIGESVFGTADTIGVCTKGINVASVRHEVGNEGCAFFVDTEGQGNKHAESDITLLTPVLLLSKVILFNWKGGMQVNQILNQLVILVEVAKRVQADSIEDNTPILGCLNIVLRDFHYQGMLHISSAGTGGRSAKLEPPSIFLRRTKPPPQKNKKLPGMIF